MRLTNISFGKKLGGAFGAVLLLLAAISILSCLSIRNITTQARQAKEANALAMMFSDKLVDHLDWLIALDQFLAHPKGKQLQLTTDGHKCQLGLWLYGKDRQRAIERFPQLATLTSQIEAPHGRLHASAIQLNKLFSSGDPEGAIEKAVKIYQTQTYPAIEEVRGHMETIRSNLLEMAHASEVALNDKAKTTGRNVTVMAICAIGLAIFLSFAMTRYVTRRINRLVGFAENIARGDFTDAITAKSDDELGRLADALNDMRTRLGTLLGSFISGVTHLSASSQELFGISKEMSDGSEHMSESSITVAAAAEEMSANMTSVAAASEQASANINMVAAAAEELTATVSEIAQSSERAHSISEEAVTTAGNASTRVNELGSAAAQISKVTEVINEISEQTNLLALNATIEAARAGEAGKGFAVVANEIKELARQTATATGDIKSEIEGIQTTTNSTVGEINQISEVINRVNDIVATIASAVEEQSATTQEIAANVAQASEGIQVVNVNVSQSSAVSSEIAKDITVVSQVAGNISGSSSTVSSNAGDLSGFTVKLKDMLGEFKLPADLDNGAPIKRTGQGGENIADLIRWNDAIKVDVAIFDNQHKKLVQLINKLHRAMKSGNAGNSVETILAELVAYTKTHFKAEEGLMRKHGYNGLAEHEKHHHSLIQQVAAAQEKVASGNATLSMDVMNFLKEWLTEHIQGEDRQYTPFFASKGVS